MALTKRLDEMQPPQNDSEAVELSGPIGPRIFTASQLVRVEPVSAADRGTYLAGTVSLLWGKDRGSMIFTK